MRNACTQPPEGYSPEEWEAIPVKRRWQIRNRDKIRVYNREYLRRNSLSLARSPFTKPRTPPPSPPRLPFSQPCSPPSYLRTALMPDILSPKEIEEIRGRVEAATPGPWRWTWRENDQTWPGAVVMDGHNTFGGYAIAMCPKMRGPGERYSWEHDAALLASSRTDIPRLLAHADALQARAEAAESELARLKEQGEWRLVPVEPTPEMCAAAGRFNYGFVGQVDLWVGLYRAMLSAAPPAPSQSINAEMLAAFDALIIDVENKFGDPHTLRHAKQSLAIARAQSSPAQDREATRAEAFREAGDAVRAVWARLHPPFHARSTAAEKIVGELIEAFLALSAPAEQKEAGR